MAVVSTLFGVGGEDLVSRERWDERYGTEELIWEAEPNGFLVAETERLVPGRALDVACGEGRNAVWLAEKGWDVTGVDFSRVGLAKARQLAADRGVEVTWVEADVVRWLAQPGSFDLVVVLYLHLPGEQRRQMLDHATASLAPGGVLLVVGHDRSNLLRGTGGPQDPAVLFAPEDLVAELGDLQIERAERVVRKVVTDAGEATAFDALVRAVRRH
ncbi:MAG: class I SAM-dependent methyltransferase [Acidimicrobiales bacterium]